MTIASAGVVSLIEIRREIGWQIAAATSLRTVRFARILLDSTYAPGYPSALSEKPRRRVLQRETTATRSAVGDRGGNRRPHESHIG
jgi:hypothetical protein